MKRVVILASILMSSLLAIPAFAQPAGTPAHAAGPGMIGQPTLGAAGQGAQRAARLQRIGLDPATAQKVQQIHRKYQAERQPIKQQVQTHRARIAELLRANSDDQNAYRAAIQGLKTARKTLEATKDREAAELQQVLTPKQQAQMLAALRKRNANRANAQDGQPPRRGRRGGQRGNPPPAGSPR